MPWMLPAAILASTAISAGTSLLGGNDTSESTYTPTQLPDYPEATQSRQNLSSTLQQWSTQPGYGAIQPDWNDIWNKASQKIQQYYGGTAMNPGVMDTINASVARRNMQDSPAGSVLQGRMLAEEGGQLSDLAGQQSLAQAQISQQGQQTWLNAMMNLAGMKPSYGGGTTTSSSPTDYSGITSTIGQGLGQYATQKSQQDFYTQMARMMGASPGYNLGQAAGGSAASAMYTAGC
jgi:hypothetical protein